MDNIARMGEKMLYLAKTMGMSKEEENERYLNLSIMHTKDYMANEKDPATMAYMEDVFADALMQSLIFHNVMLERVVESLGQDVFMLHHDDLIEKLTEEQMLDLNVAATITNIVLPGGMAGNKDLVDFINDYKKKHPGAAAIDAEKFVMASTAYSAVLFRLNVSDDVGDFLEAEHKKQRDNFAHYDHDVYKKVIKGKLNYQEIMDWWEENKDDPKMIKYADSMMMVNADMKNLVGIYLYFHPEKMDKNFVNLMTDENMRLTMTFHQTGMNPDMIGLARYGFVKPKTVKEIQKYEASLKQRKMKAERFFDINNETKPSEADPYLMHDQYAMIVAYVEGKKQRKEPVTQEEEKEAEMAATLMKNIEDREAKQQNLPG